MPFTFGHVWIILLILVVVLIFGPRRLPELGSSIGRAIREFRSGMNEVREEVRHAGDSSSSSATTSTETTEARPQTEVRS